MNRVERRREDRKNYKREKWVKSLTKEQRRLMVEYCIEQSEINIMYCCEAYERVLRPTLYEMLENEIEAEELLKKIVFDVRLEGINFRDSGEGGAEYVRKIEESKKNIIDEYMQMEQEGMSEKEIFEELKVTFPKLTANSIKNAIVEYKREIKKKQIVDMDSTEDALNYIFKQEVKGENMETAKETTELKKLEILSITLKGEYGIYEKGPEGIKTADKVFKDIQRLGEYKEGVQSRIGAEKEDINRQIRELNKKFSELSEIERKENNMIAELKQIFDM